MGTPIPLMLSDHYGCEYLFNVPTGGGQPSDSWLTFKGIKSVRSFSPAQFSGLKLQTSPTDPRGE